MFTAQELRSAHYSHAQHYLKQLQIAGALYRKGGSQIAHSLAKFTQDWPQIEQGQAWAARSLENDQAARLCCDFPLAGVELLSVRHAVGDRIRWLETALDAARRLGLRRAECDHLCALGRAYWLAGHIDEAAARLDQALALAEADRNRAGIARAHRLIGDLQASQSAYAEARQHGQISLKLYQALKDRRGTADTLCSLGNLALMVDDYAAASDLLERSLSTYRELEDRTGEAQVLARLGSLAGTQRNFALAEQHFSQSHALYSALDHQEGLGQTSNMLGTIATVLGNFAQAEGWFQQSLKIHTRLGNQDGIAGAYMKLGEIDQYTGQLERAGERYRVALDIYRAMNNLYNVAGVAFRLGNVALMIDDDDEAERWFRQSADLCRAVDRPLLASSLSGLAQIACRQKRYAEAEQFFQAGLADALARGDTWIIADLHQEWGNMALELNDRDGAREHLQPALDLALEMDAAPLALSILGSFARLLIADQPELALEVAWFVFENPAGLQDDKEGASSLIETLEAALPPDTAARIRSQARTDTLVTLVHRL